MGGGGCSWSNSRILRSHQLHPPTEVGTLFLGFFWKHSGKWKPCYLGLKLEDVIKSRFRTFKSFWGGRGTFGSLVETEMTTDCLTPKTDFLVCRKTERGVILKVHARPVWAKWRFGATICHHVFVGKTSVWPKAFSKVAGEGIGAVNSQNKHWAVTACCQTTVTLYLAL